MATHEKISLDPNFKDFIALLNSEKVEYLLLGGYAVNFYGHHRFTGDIDFWIATDRSNAERVARALEGFGFSKGAINVDSLMVPNQVIMMGVVPVRIDLLTGPSGVEFADCYARRLTVEIDGTAVSIISLADLRTNKLASGRDKDLSDLKHLPPA